MATCARETGLLFWKKRCDGPSIGPCDQCRLFICQHHGNIQGDGGLLCNQCANVEEEDSGGSWFSTSSSGSDGDASFSSDSASSSDSGGGGDGGSGGD
jgi:hypothetical protein